jgi:predicted DNA-binding transcriptional regulator YafY
MKIDRLLAIVLLLLNRRKVSATELSERFEVSVRTIYRDIETIDAAGIPIISHQGVGGGFSIMDHYRLEKQLLTPEEIMSMVSVLKGVGEALGDTRVLHSGKKIESLIGHRSPVNLKDEIRVELSPWGYRGEQNALLETVRKATVQRKLVRFTYRNSTGEAIDRTVEPMTLVFKGSAWYLFAYCRTRSDYRMFRLSRMRSFFVTGEGFERKPYCYESYAKQFQASEDDLVEFELKFSEKVRFLVEDAFSPNQIFPQENDAVVVRAPIPMGDWFIGWILSYGEHVEVTKPNWAREVIKEKLHNIQKLYAYQQI